MQMGELTCNLGAMSKILIKLILQNARDKVNNLNNGLKQLPFEIPATATAHS